MALHWVGTDGTILRANDAELAMLGYSREEYVGKNIADFHVSRTEIENILERLAAGDVLTDYPAQMKRKDGTICDVLIHSSAYWENGKFTYTRCFTRDVTEHNRTAEALRRSNEEAHLSRQLAEAANQAKDTFLAALSHELRTPLTPILLTATDLAGDPSLSTEAREEMEMICRNVQLEARLIDDLLDVTRITRGKLALAPSRISLHEVVEKALKVVRPDTANRKLQIQVSLEAQHDAVWGDPDRLQQVFWNLLKNAIKFTPDGGSITLRSSNSAANVISISVLDTGRGISPQALGSIFDPFDQGTLNGRHSFGGLGLGLAISKGVVDLHGGKLTAESDGEGKGAVFTVELPTPAEP
jgi:PAS domain S-box-containing protein